MRAPGQRIFAPLTVLLLVAGAASEGQPPGLTPAMIEKLRARGFNLPPNSEVSFRSKDGKTIKKVLSTGADGGGLHSDRSREAQVSKHGGSELTSWRVTVARTRIIQMMKFQWS